MKGGQGVQLAHTPFFFVCDLWVFYALRRFWLIAIWPQKTTTKSSQMQNGQAQANVIVELVL